MASDASYRHDAALIAEMRSVIATSYQGEPAMFRADLARCDRGYFLRKGTDLVAFFVVAFVEPSDILQQPAVFLGLSATDERHKNSGIVRQLYERFTVDAYDFERRCGRDVLMFGILATPSSFHAVHSLWSHAQPEVDGSFKEESVEFARLSRTWLGADDNTEHPFVLRQYAKGTFYSSEERERIAGLCRRHRFQLFEHLRIDERNGDRLLVTCRLPRS